MSFGAGAGLDVAVTKFLTIRAGQIDYLGSRFELDIVGPESALRFSTGLVFTFGER